MKTLKLSTLVLLLVSVFASCTREDLPASRDTETRATSNSKALAAIENFNVDPNPAYYSQDVTVTGTLHFDKAVNKFTATVEKATPASTNPDGTINWNAFAPTTYKLDTTLPSGVWVTTLPFSFTFPASGAGLGKTKWQLHVSGNDAKSVKLGSAVLEVKPDPVVAACNGLSLIGEVANVEEPEAGSDLYTFTVVYTVNPCGLEFNKLKTQGGLTNGIVWVSSVGGADRQPGNSSNKVITWTEGENDGPALSTDERKYTIVFKKAWDGMSEIELTGDWSVSASLLDGGETKATFGKINYPQ